MNQTTEAHLVLPRRHLPGYASAVTGNELRTEILDSLEGPWPQYGLLISGVTVTGQLDLSNISLPGMLAFTECMIEELAILNAKLDGMLVSDCKVGPVLMSGLDCRSILTVEDSAIDSIYMRGANVAAGVGIRSSRIGNNRNDIAFDAAGASFGRLSTDGSLFHGRIDATNCDVKGDVSFASSAIASDPETATVNFEGSKIQGDLVFAGNIIGGLRASRCSATQVIVAGTLVSDGKPFAMNFDGINASGNVALRDFRAHGTVRMMGATIGAQLHLGPDVDISALGSIAFAADSSKIAELVSIRRSQFHGMIRFMGTRLEDQISISDVRVFAIHPSGLLFDRAHIHGNISVESSRIVGGMDIDSTVIGGQFVAHNCTFIAGRLDNALSGQRTDIGGHVLCPENLFVGSIDFHGAQIGGQLALRDSVVDVGGFSPAISLGRSTCDQLFIDGGFHANGSVDLDGMVVRGVASFTGASVLGLEGTAISGRSSRMDSLALQTQDIRGIVDLTSSSVSEVFDLPKDWFSASLEAHNSTIRRWESGLDWPPKSRLEWLSTVAHHSISIERALAYDYMEMGQSKFVRKVRIRGAQGRSRSVGRLLAVVGYGYRPSLAVLAILLAVGVVFFSIVFLHPSGLRGGALASAGIAVETVIPIASLGLVDREFLRSSPPLLRLVMLSSRAFGWVGLALLTAALSGLVQQLATRDYLSD